MTGIARCIDYPALVRFQESFGCKILSDDEVNRPWPIEGIIHPGVTAITGQPLIGKTTLALALVRIVLNGKPWEGHAVNFPAGAKVLFMAENAAGVRRAQELGRDFPGRVLAVQTVPVLAGTADAAGDLKEMGVRLVVIDSAWAATGDLNDGARASYFLTAIRRLGVPVVVIHHARKGGDNSGIDTGGSQAWPAAYEHFIVVKAGGRTKIFGNDVEGTTSLTLRTQREGTTELMPAGPAGVVGPGSPTNARPGAAATAHDLGVLARELQIDTTGDHNMIATLLVGGSRDHEDPALAALVGTRVFRQATIGHRTVANLIKHERAAFDAGVTEAP